MAGEVRLSAAEEAAWEALIAPGSFGHVCSPQGPAERGRRYACPTCDARWVVLRAYGALGPLRWVPLRDPS